MSDPQMPGYSGQEQPTKTTVAEGSGSEINPNELEGELKLIEEQLSARENGGAPQEMSKESIKVLEEILEKDLAMLEVLKGKLAEIRQMEAAWEKEAEERANRLISLEITGDIIKDGQAFIEIMGANVSEMSEQWRKSFESGDEEGILEYFRTLKTAIDMNLGNFPEAIARSQEITSMVIGKILLKAEEKKREKKTREEIEKL